VRYSDSHVTINLLPAGSSQAEANRMDVALWLTDVSSKGLCLGDGCSYAALHEPAHRDHAGQWMDSFICFIETNDVSVTSTVQTAVNPNGALLSRATRMPENVPVFSRADALIYTYLASLRSFPVSCCVLELA
jgi:hypothetical protein